MKFSNSVTVIKQTPDDPRCVAILQTYGSAAEMVIKWGPAKVLAISQAVKRSAQVPALVLMIRTYSQDVMESLIQAHVSSSIAALGIGDKFSISDCALIARLVCVNAKLRTLNMAYLLSFFAELQMGEIQLYGFTPYTVISAYMEYYKKAVINQAKTIEAFEKQEKKKEEEAHKAEAISWDEYCKEQGLIPGDNPLTFYKKGYNNEINQN